MKPRSLTPLWSMPRSSSRSTAWLNVACETANAMWCTQPGSVGVRSGVALALLVGEDRDQAPVAGVEVEVALGLVVEVGLLEDERHAEHALPEVDRRLPVGADEGDVVDALALELLHGASSYRLSVRVDSTPRRRAPSGSRSGARRSSARCASRPAVRASSGTAFTAADGKPRSSITAAIGIETFSVSGLPRPSVTASRNARRERDVRPAHPALVGELEDSLRARVDRPVHGMAEARAACSPAACMRSPVFAGDRRRRPRRRRPSPAPRSSSCAHASEVPRMHRAGAEDPRRDGALKRVGVGGERHPRRDVRRHHPVLGDRDQQQVEEEALVVGGLVAGQQQVEVLGEREPSHQVAGRGRGRAPRPGRRRPG